MVFVTRQNKYHTLVLLSTYTYNFTETKGEYLTVKCIQQQGTFGVRFELPNVK